MHVYGQERGESNSRPGMAISHQKQTTQRQKMSITSLSVFYRVHLSNQTADVTIGWTDHSDREIALLLPFQIGLCALCMEKRICYVIARGEQCRGEITD